MITTLKTKEDGSILGVDQDGNLFNGLLVEHSHQECVSEIISQESGIIEYVVKIGDEVIGGGSIEESNYSAGPYTAVFGENGEEKKIKIINWTAI